MTSEKEILTTEAFAGRMGISRSTAYSWLAAGRLETGRHVLRLGKVIRIIWDDALMEHLLKQSVTENNRPALVRKGRGGRNVCSLDSDYLR